MTPEQQAAIEQIEAFEAKQAGKKSASKESLGPGDLLEQGDYGAYADCRSKGGSDEQCRGYGHKDWFKEEYEKVPDETASGQEIPGKDNYDESAAYRAAFSRDVSGAVDSVKNAIPQGVRDTAANAWNTIAGGPSGLGQMAKEAVIGKQHPQQQGPVLKKVMVHPNGHTYELVGGKYKLVK